MLRWRFPVRWWIADEEVAGTACGPILLRPDVIAEIIAKLENPSWSLPDVVLEPESVSRHPPIRLRGLA